MQYTNTAAYLDEPISLNANTQQKHEDKMAIVTAYRKYKREAERGNSMAQYKLAESFPKGSAQYLAWMEKSAEQGLTNAMFALSQVYAEKGDVKALRFAKAILNSNDSFMKAEVNALLANHPKLKAELLPMPKASVLSIFANQTNKREVEVSTPGLSLG
ncbi:MAG: hypothetical protein LCH30_03345 [Proteobacteria bacterium]|nr:hypothetical protein [Pseudomonadota bacterium]